MKNIKRSVLVLFAMSTIAPTLCSFNSVDISQNLNKETEIISLHKHNKIPDYVIKNSAKSMSSFVSSLREYYRKGMTYNDFKRALDPKTGLAKITPEGDKLLRVGFSHLEKGTNNKDMNSEPMLRFLQYLVKDAMNHGVKDFSKYDINKASMIAFGLPSSIIASGNSTLSKDGKPCKWYQIGCLLSNLWDWINSPVDPNKPDGPTNVDRLIEIIKNVMIIIATTI